MLIKKLNDMASVLGMLAANQNQDRDSGRENRQPNKQRDDKRSDRNGRGGQGGRNGYGKGRNESNDGRKDRYYQQRDREQASYAKQGGHAKKRKTQDQGGSADSG